MGNAVTDSGWFWFGVFAMGGLIALVLAQPKYGHRQAELEREYQAREQAGQSVVATRSPGELSKSRPHLIRLEPLIWLVVSLVLVASAAFWVSRFRSKDPSHGKAS